MSQNARQDIMKLSNKRWLNNLINIVIIITWIV